MFSNEQTFFQIPRRLLGRAYPNVDGSSERSERRESEPDITRRSRRIRKSRQNRGRRRKVQRRK